MSQKKLRYLGKKALDNLYTEILENIERYRSGDFLDLVAQGNWNSELSIAVDLGILQDLDPSGGPEVEVENSLLVWKALHAMTPAMACEDRIWTRLSHVECLEYSRARWLDKKKDDTATAKSVRTHFFAPSLTACRDDHSIGRLWWNAKIAKDIRPSDQKSALELILKSADIRLSFVERSWTSSRQSIASAILKIMENQSWVTDSESNYRNFMKVINRQGGGKVFELMSPTQLDKFITKCYMTARVNT